MMLKYKNFIAKRILLSNYIRKKYKIDASQYTYHIIYLIVTAFSKAKYFFEVQAIFLKF